MACITYDIMFNKYDSNDGGGVLKKELVSEPKRHVWQLVSKAATM